MTLLVAGVDGKNIWLVSDTAVSGGELEVQEREYELNVAPSRDGRAIHWGRSSRRSARGTGCSNASRQRSRKLLA
jgi:hypothetical protein